MTFGTNISNGYLAAHILEIQKGIDWVFAEMTASDEQEHLAQCWLMTKTKYKTIGKNFKFFTRLYNLKAKAFEMAEIKQTSPEKIVEIVMRMNAGEMPTTESGFAAVKMALQEQLDMGMERAGKVHKEGGDTTKLDNRWIEILHAYEFCQDMLDGGLRLAMAERLTTAN